MRTATTKAKWLLGMREVSGAACARAFVRVCKGAFGAMLAHIPKDSLDVGVVNQRLCHDLDALALGVRVTCIGGSDRLAYVCSAGCVWMWRGVRCRDAPGQSQP